MVGEALVADAIEGRESAEMVSRGIVGGAGRARADRGDHEILRGVLGGDEFEDFGFIAGPFEKLGAESVGDEFGLALLKYAVAQGAGEDGRGGELGAEFLLTTGRDDEEAGASREAAGEGVVGRGVTGVEGEQEVDGIFGCGRE